MKRFTTLIACASLALVACSGKKDEKSADDEATPKTQATPKTKTDTKAGTTPETEATPVETDTAEGLETEEVSYEGDGITMKGYLAYDPAIEGKRPAVLVIHEWWGHDEYARKRAEMLAQMGYTALAVDMYGDGKQAAHPDDAGKFAGALRKNLDSAKARMEAAYELLQAHETTDPERMAAIGYCFGGGMVLHAARFGMDLEGVVSFHGSLGTTQPAEKGEVKAEVLVFNGADDPFVKAEEIEAFKKEMEAAGVDYEFVSYPGVTHSFTNPKADEYGEKFKLPLAYDKKADEDSWSQTKAFFEKIFAS